KDDLCHAFLYARLLEQKTDLARRDRKFFLALHHVCIYHAGLSDPKPGKLFRLVFGERPTFGGTRHGNLSSCHAFCLFVDALSSWYYLAFVSCDGRLQKWIQIATAKLNYYIRPQ